MGDLYLTMGSIVHSAASLSSAGHVIFSSQWEDYVILFSAKVPKEIRSHLWEGSSVASDPARQIK